MRRDYKARSVKACSFVPPSSCSAFLPSTRRAVSVSTPQLQSLRWNISVRSGHPPGSVLHPLDFYSWYLYSSRFRKKYHLNSFLIFDHLKNMIFCRAYFFSQTLWNFSVRYFVRLTVVWMLSTVSWILAVLESCDSVMKTVIFDHSKNTIF